MQILDSSVEGVTHSDIELHPDPGRTIVRPFLPGDPEGYMQQQPRPQRIADRVLGLSEAFVENAVERLLRVVENRPRNFAEYLLHRFDEVNGAAFAHCSVSDARKKLIAAYFCAEYSYEAAALFNPSIILCPWDNQRTDGGVKFMMSLRAVGEGHVSSVTFRSGVWHPDRGFAVDDASNRSITPRIVTDEGDSKVTRLACDDGEDISEVVMFPATPSQRQGIEDMRMVAFSDGDGQPDIFGTYTAYDGRHARPEMMHTSDFANFTLRPLEGQLSTGKGMALFPRKVGGRYLMLARQDMENIWLLESDDPFTWDKGRRIVEPANAWEFVQLGNCGSPIEIDEGWLVLTHGVGVVRSYAIGACLLDKNDPNVVLGRLQQPLMRPVPVGARNGYFPNVVYSCGGMVHDRTLLLPYGVADTYTRFASVPLDALLGAMA
jgi:predicted GH43/DUF377 family glycosyl hydrolase